MKTKTMILSVAYGVVIALASTACSKSDATDSTAADGQLSAVEKAAQDAVLAEVKKHWVKAPEGWMTARMYGTSFAPIYVLRQMRELTAEGVREYDLTDSDWLNEGS